MNDDTVTIEGLDPEFKVLPLSALMPDPKNPRVHTAENINEIAESIKTLGFTNPIQVVPITDEAEPTYRIIAGHGRYLALKQLGVEVAPCVILHHLENDPARAMAANIADNEIALHSYYDDELLAMTLNELQEASEMLVTASGIDMDRFMDIAYGNAEVSEDIFEINDTSVADFKAKIDGGNNVFENYQNEHIKTGDVFILGEANAKAPQHRLMYGDITDATDMEALMAGESADMLITDAPSLLKNQKRDDYRQSFTEALGIAKEILNKNKGGVFYVLYENELTLEVLNAINDAGLFRQQNLIWAMNNMLVSGRYDYRMMHENIAFGTSQTDYNPIIHQDIAYGFTDKKLKTWSNDKKQPSVIQVDTKNKMKPIKLVGYFIKNHLKPDESVLDLKAGNGVELIACDQLHRKYYGVDGDKDAILTTLCRYAEDTRYKQPIINSRTGENITDSLKTLARGV